MFRPILAAAAAGLAAFASSWLLQHAELKTITRVLAALVPGPFFVWFVLEELRWVRRMDEFQRRVVLDSLAIAFPIAITIGVVIDGLQKGGFVSTWTVGDVWPFMALVWLPALWIAGRRYPRDDVDE
jgi:hypothetical protein